MIEQVRLAQLQKPQTPRSRVRRVEADRSAPASSREQEASAELDPSEDQELSEIGDAAPVKKRRRRRKPVNREGGAAVASPASDSSAEH